MFKLTIADPKTKKCYQTEHDTKSLLGMNIGSKFDGSAIGLEGYEFEIRGGSDDSGFPMRKDVHGTAKKRLLLTNGCGFNTKVDGLRKRKIVRGNTISEGITQINCKVLKSGKKNLEEMFGKKEKEKKEED